jgi:hypothetical protein
LHDMRAQLAGGGINDLKFFFNADGEAVSHGVALRILGLWGLPGGYHTPPMGKIHPERLRRRRLTSNLAWWRVGRPRTSSPP